MDGTGARGGSLRQVGDGVERVIAEVLGIDESV